MNFQSLVASPYEQPAPYSGKVAILPWFIGTDMEDEIFGDVWNNYIWGYEGNDRLYGSYGDDHIFGGAGRDFIFGGEGNDSLFGGLGGDYFYGDPGADTIDGGDGDDYLSYEDSASGVTVNLETGIGQGGDAQGDVYVDVENVGGSHYDDVIVGNSERNELVGFDGNDRLNGGGGNDLLWGGNGADVFIFDHNDYNESDLILDFQPGVDKIDLSNTEVRSWTDLNNGGDGDYMEQVSGKVVIHSSDNDIITLHQTQMSDLSPSDFIF
ncbi:MAG: calcium-binding protein [Methyloligellaceae bacterium]